MGIICGDYLWWLSMAIIYGDYLWWLSMVIIYGDYLGWLWWLVMMTPAIIMTIVIGDDDDNIDIISDCGCFGVL